MNLKAQKLREFNYELVRARLDGFFFNVERDLQKQIGMAIRSEDGESERCLSLLIVFLRFARNSYDAVRYVTANATHEPDRRSNYVIVVPSINRQLLDLLFSLVYMLDDLGPRSLEYQRAGWRDWMEEKSQFEAMYGADAKWQQYFADLDVQLNRMERRFHITAEERANLDLVNYWPTPFKITKRNGASQPFLEHLEKWIYKDVSLQAHLGFAGLQKISNFLVSDLLGDQVSEEQRHRALSSYHFQQVSRVAIAFLAIATEIDTYCSLGNSADADYLWTVFSEYVAEAKKIYELRYRDRVRSVSERFQS